MRFLRAAAVGIALAMLAAPEMLRYAAERRLARANAAFDYVLSRPAEVENAIGILEAVTDAAVTTAPVLVGDSRAWVLAGSSQLVARNAERALGCYREALAVGERAEIHLNFGRAAALASQKGAAEAAFLRALWISPALVRAVPPEFVTQALVDVARLEGELVAGRLTAPPPPPN
jgi:tetratricopeptide (TPR) repeat protein